MTKNGPYLTKEVKALSAGLQFWGKYIINDKNQRKTRDGREIINLKLGDPSGEMEVVVWENCQVAGALEKGCVVGLLGDTGMYNGRLQVTAKRVKILDEDPLLYLRSPAIAREVLSQQFDQVIDSITDPHLINLLRTILYPEQKKAFLITPAAKRVHHHYLGGLLEHTLNVVRLCEQAVAVYPSLNRDLLITGAVLHDIGKIEEYQLNILPEYTLPGKMMGHIVLGHNMVERAIMELRQKDYAFPEILEIMVKHMILSHHGTLEFGSPVKPLFPEAYLLHVMDNLDAKMYVYFEKMSETENLDHFMTAYDGFHQQQFFTYRYSSPGEDDLTTE